MYEKHELKVVNFERTDVFADLSIASDADDEEGGGSGKYSWEPDRSDS